MATKGNLFVHTLRPKKKIPPELSQTLPLPLQDDKLTYPSKIEAIFTGYSVDVKDPDAIRSLCLKGGFGQGMLSRAFPACLTSPLEASRKSKRNIAEAASAGMSFGRLEASSKAQEPLCLCLEEAFFLLQQLDILKLKTMKDEVLSIAETFEKFRKLKKSFYACYCAYLYLKAKNWIIKSGLKFGGDFVIYVKGPQFYHASYIVMVQAMFRGKQLSSHIMDGLDFQGFNRIAETTAKDILFLEVHYPESLDLQDDADCLKKIKDVRVAETFTKHHNYIAARN